MHKITHSLEENNKIRMKLHNIKKEIVDGGMQMADPANMLDDMEYIPNKASRNDVIEYNPAELSLEDSDASGKLFLLVVEISHPSYCLYEINASPFPPLKLSHPECKFR